MTQLLPLDPDELLSTTRAVRKRLDFTRPVPSDLVRECVALALQAPSGSNEVTMGFVVVTDAVLRAEIGRVYREAYEVYRASDSYAGARRRPTTEGRAQQERVASSADFLAEHMGDAPAIVVAVNRGPTREVAQAMMGNVLPGMWSFMLAARARGLGTAWTTMTLRRERDIAALLEIPYDTVAQAVMTPLAYTIGTDFRAADRPTPDEVIHWNRW